MSRALVQPARRIRRRAGLIGAAVLVTLAVVLMLADRVVHPTQVGLWLRGEGR